MPTRVSSAEDCDNQVDRMTSSLDTSQPISPASPAVAQWAHEQSGHGDRDGSYDGAQQHGLHLTKASLATAATACPIWRPTPSLQCGFILEAVQPAAWWLVD